VRGKDRRRAVRDEQERRREGAERIVDALRTERRQKDRAFSEALELWKERSSPPHPSAGPVPDSAQSGRTT
jgi:hypothetical protein